MPADTIPDGFVFTAVPSAELATQYVSNTITITGVNASTAISIVGGEYSINNGGFTTIAGSINSGDTLTIRAISSGGYSTLTNTTITVGGMIHLYSLTTKAVSGSSGGGMSGNGGG
jgi:agarase